MAECLTNAVVLRKIFQHISNPELLKLSFVNKLWNYEARSVMKNRGTLIARLKFHDNQACQEYLDAFGADLLGMNVVPFSGIRIQLGHCQHSCQIPVPCSTYQSILDQLPLKKITIALAAEYLENKSCPGSVLARTALTNMCGVLEEVSLVHIGLPKDFERRAKILRYIQDCSFPNLKILRLGENYKRCDPTYITEYLRALVDSSPKLTELHVYGPINLMLNVRKRRFTAFVLPSDDSFDNSPDNVIDSIPGMLLQKFSATLDSIDVDASLAVALMGYEIRFENVSCLTMSINHGPLEPFEPPILSVLNKFDLTRIFPNLGKVSIFPTFAVHPRSLNHILLERVSALMRDPEPDRAIFIKELDLYGAVCNYAEFYAAMFPRIEQLGVLQNSRETSLGSVWENWPDLKVLNVVVHEHCHVERLDSVICGIFPEEMAELKQKNEEFLKKVNIVPVKPAMTCLRNLRKFALFFVPQAEQPADIADHQGFQSPLPKMFSRVTELVAFAKFPDLDVTLSNLCSVCFSRTFDPKCTC